MSAAYEDAEPDEDEFPDLDEKEIGGKVRINLADMDLQSWEHDLKADLAVINSLFAEMQKITPDQDAKLQHLKGQIEAKLAKPINPGNRKLLIFTAFADTANYLYANIAPDVLAQHGLHTGKVTGTESPKTTLDKGYDFQSVLTLFSPISKEKDASFRTSAARSIS